MTNQIEPGKLHGAKKWAGETLKRELIRPPIEYCDAAAEVINALPDEWIDAAKLREVIEGWHTTTNQTMHRVDKTYKSAAADLEALLPTPQPRTLEDMTREEREACQFMQADFDDGMLVTPVRVVITKARKTTADIILPEGATRCVSPDKLTPLPELPRMVWPDAQATTHDDEGMAPEEEEGTYGKPFWEMVTKAIRDEKEYHIDAQDYEGVKRWRDAERALHTAMETNPPKESPVPTRPEDVPEGEVWIVECYGDRHVGTRDPNEAPNWALARMDGLDTTFAGDELVDLVTRLVPEVKA